MIDMFWSHPGVGHYLSGQFNDHPTMTLHTGIVLVSEAEYRHGKGPWMSSAKGAYVCINPANF